VQQEAIDIDFLASQKVGTPDPRKEDPPKGKRLLVSWDFPKSLFDQNLTLLVTVRLWDHTEEVIAHPVERRRGYATFLFSSKTQEPLGGKVDPKALMTYRIQVYDEKGCLIETWKHHFWTDRIY
jgi:hypothetical protein